MGDKPDEEAAAYEEAEQIRKQASCDLSISVTSG